LGYDWFHSDSKIGPQSLHTAVTSFLSHFIPVVSYHCTSFRCVDEVTRIKCFEWSDLDEVTGGCMKCTSMRGWYDAITFLFDMKWRWCEETGTLPVLLYSGTWWERPVPQSLDLALKALKSFLPDENLKLSRFRFQNRTLKIRKFKLNYHQGNEINLFDYFFVKTRSLSQFLKMETYVKQRKYFSEIKTGYKVGSPKEKPFGKPETRDLNCY